METYHKIIFGDSRNMEEIESSSIQLVVTSPPYWQLKDYGPANQIGFNDSYEDYINHLNLVWNECYRVLEKGCRLCINIGDQFARSVYYGRYKIMPIRTEIIRFCETIGFDYMGAVIWQKVTTCNTTGGATIMGSFPYPRNGILKIDYEFILIFKKPGKTKPLNKSIKEKSKMTTEEWNQYFNGHWNFPGEKQDKHLAMFPIELPKRLIKMFSFVEDTVLDPFLGSGTTCLAALEQTRNSIGYEINHEFRDLIQTKISHSTNGLFQKNHISFKSQNTVIDFKQQLEKLPYIFNDPVSFDKKINPKKLQFGSKIDRSNSKKTEYFRIKNVLSPNHVLLNNDLEIRLLGIKEKKKTRQEAIDFLRRKTKGQRVFLKFDSQKYDTYNKLLCYLYLENKTFLNSHLLKRKIVDIDTSIDFKYKNKFLIEAKNGKRMDS